MKYDINKHDLRWTSGNYKDKNPETKTYIETLQAMCDAYGSFCGMWHSNVFWARTKKELGGMTELQAKEKVFAIENDADCSREQWRQCQ